MKQQVNRFASVTDIRNAHINLLPPPPSKGKDLHEVPTRRSHKICSHIRLPLIGIALNETGGMGGGETFPVETPSKNTTFEAWA